MASTGRRVLCPPADAKDAAKTSGVETVDLLLLLGIGCPGFTPLREDADYVCVHRSGQLGVLLNASGQSS